MVNHACTLICSVLVCERAWFVLRDGSQVGSGWIRLDQVHRWGEDPLTSVHTCSYTVRKIGDPCTWLWLQLWLFEESGHPREDAVVAQSHGGGLLGKRAHAHAVAATSSFRKAAWDTAVSAYGSVAPLAALCVLTPLSSGQPPGFHGVGGKYFFLLLCCAFESFHEVVIVSQLLVCSAFTCKCYHFISG